MNANYRKLPVNFRIIADSAAKLQKKPHNGEDKTGKTVCQIFNFLSIKKKVTFRSISMRYVGVPEANQ